MPGRIDETAFKKLTKEKDRTFFKTEKSILNLSLTRGYFEIKKGADSKIATIAETQLEKKMPNPPKDTTKKTKPILRKF
ncbi:MAG: hypothetical protein JRI96_13360 [Deltaproteobacteria bacterium]|nr:hypothetical protein [Deltaproteobacteria bacterium]